MMSAGMLKHHGQRYKPVSKEMLQELSDTVKQSRIDENSPVMQSIDQPRRSSSPLINSTFQSRPPSSTIHITFHPRPPSKEDTFSPIQNELDVDGAHEHIVRKSLYTFTQFAL